MKRFLMLALVFLAAVSLIFIGCSDENDQNKSALLNNNTVAQAKPTRLAVTFFDKPALEGVEHLNLHIVEVGVHHEDSGWAYNEVDTTIDFLELVNGVTVTLFNDTVPPGYYSQMRLVLGDGNEIVVDSQTYPLTIPSGQQTGIKLNLNCEISPMQFVKLYVDFDVSKSVVVANNRYKLKPTYKVFKQDISATVSGVVTDLNGISLSGTLVEANSTDYNTATYTDSTGAYMFILPQGIYDISAVPDSGHVVDTSYSGVMLHAGDSITGFDFVISEEAVITNGIISGVVTDTLGNPVVSMVGISPAFGNDFVWTDSTGFYMFDVPAGTYEISITPAPGFVVDTVYTGVVLASGDTLSGLDFVISSEEIVVEGPGIISGSVLNTLGMPFPIMMVSAISATDTTLTMTDSLGMYMFILDPGTYDVSSLPSFGLTADTSYIGVILSSGDTLTGYDFLIQ